jgi:hypothetical protein
MTPINVRYRIKSGRSADMLQEPFLPEAVFHLSRLDYSAPFKKCDDFQ